MNDYYGTFSKLIYLPFIITRFYVNFVVTGIFLKVANFYRRRV